MALGRPSVRDNRPTHPRQAGCSRPNEDEQTVVENFDLDDPEEEQIEGVTDLLNLQNEVCMERSEGKAAYFLLRDALLQVVAASQLLACSHRDVDHQPPVN